MWNAKNKRIIRKLGKEGEAVSSMTAIVNHLLGVLTVWVAHFDGSVVVWVASDLDNETLLMDQYVSAVVWFPYVLSFCKSDFLPSFGL